MGGERIGLIVPSSNTVMEADLYRRLPPHVTLHTARMYLEETTPEGESRMLDDHLPGAIVDLATARPDITVFGCTSAGALRGNEYEARLVASIAEQTASTVVSVAASVRAAIALRRARRIGVITPYIEALNVKIRESLEAEGVEVAAVRGLGITDNFAIAAVGVDRIADYCAECFNARDIDLLFISCTNLRAFDARHQIERKLGVAVVTSNQAALEAVLAHLGDPTVA